MLVNGRTIEARRIEGDEPTLVFLHEGLGCVALWRDFPDRACAVTGCSGFVYSRFGYGMSDPRPLPWPLDYMEQEAALLPAVLAAAGIGDAVLVGHSDGASIALLAAAAAGVRSDANVKAVLAMAPHVVVEAENVATIQATGERFRSGDLRERLAKYHRDVDVAFGGWFGSWTAPAFRSWDITAALATLRAPLTIVQGDADPYGSIAQAELALRAAGAPRPGAELVVVAGGHAPHQEAPEETMAALVAVVERARRC